MAKIQLIVRDPKDLKMFETLLYLFVIVLFSETEKIDDYNKVCSVFNACSICISALLIAKLHKAWRTSKFYGGTPELGSRWSFGTPAKNS